MNPFASFAHNAKADETDEDPHQFAEAAQQCKGNPGHLAVTERRDQQQIARILRAEAGPQHEQLITDLFERITLYEVKLTEAKSTRRPDGRYDVALTIEGRKLYADGRGKEREARLDEPFDIGIFSAEPGKKDFTKDSVLLFERRPITDGRQTLTVTVDKAPVWAGVDPYNKRIDRNSDDNLARVVQ